MPEMLILHYSLFVFTIKKGKEVLCEPGKLKRSGDMTNWYSHPAE